MRLTVLGSSSTGNCYFLTSQAGEVLILECGIRFEKIKQALSFNYSAVAGVLITHEHGDHCKAYKEVLSSGMKLYCTNGTAKALGIDWHHNFHRIEKKRSYTVGSFKVMPFAIQHDVAEPVGFMIYHKECGNVLFITDTHFVSYRFPGMNNIIVEANYCSDIINKRVVEGSLDNSLRLRIEESHMSINTCHDFLLANDLSTVNNIVLIHLSDGNSNAEQFQKKIKELTGKNVFIANPGVVIDNFNISPI